MKKIIYLLLFVFALVSCSTDEPQKDIIFHEVYTLDSPKITGGAYLGTLIWDLSDFPYSTEELSFNFFYDYENDNKIYNDEPYRDISLFVYMPCNGGHFKLDAGRGYKCLNRLVRERNFDMPKGYKTIGKYFSTATDFLDYLGLHYDKLGRMDTLYNAVEEVLDIPGAHVVTYVDDENTRTGKLEVGEHKFVNNDDGSFECTIGENKTGKGRVVNIYIVENHEYETECYPNFGRDFYIFQPAK